MFGGGKILLYTIGKLSQLSGITIRTLRYYESVGLIEPATRSSGNYRLYSEDMIRQAQAIHVLKQIETPLEEIKKLIVAQTNAHGQERGKRVTEILEEKLDETRKMINQLTQVTAILEDSLRVSKECALCLRECDNCMRDRFTADTYPSLLLYNAGDESK